MIKQDIQNNKTIILFLFLLFVFGKHSYSQKNILLGIEDTYILKVHLINKIDSINKKDDYLLNFYNKYKFKIDTIFYMGDTTVFNNYELLSVRNIYIEKNINIPDDTILNIAATNSIDKKSLILNRLIKENLNNCLFKYKSGKCIGLTKIRKFTFCEKIKYLFSKKH